MARHKFFLSVVFLSALALLLTSCSDEAPAPEKVEPQKKEPVPQYSLPTITIENSGENEEARFKPGSLEDGVPTPGNEPKKIKEVRETGIDDLSKEPEKAQEMLLGQREQNRGSKWQITRDTKADSTADLMSRNDPKKFVWLPKFTGNAITPVLVSDVELSPDGSVVAFVEWFLSPKKHFGTRLIFMDTASWQFIDYIEIPQRKIGKIIWLPTKNAIVGLCIAQSGLAQPHGIVKIDLQKKIETGFVRTVENVGQQTFLALDNGDRILADHPERPELLIVEYDKFEREAIQHMPVDSRRSICTLYHDGSRLAVAAQKGRYVQIYATSDLKNITNKKLPENYPLQQIIFLNQKDFFIAGKSAIPVAGTLLRNSLFITTPGKSEGMALLSANGKEIYHLLQGREISVVDAITGQEIRKIRLDSAQPALKEPGPGRVLKMFEIPEINGIAIFDANGSFYLISMNGDKKGKGTERVILFKRRK